MSWTDATFRATGLLSRALDGATLSLNPSACCRLNGLASVGVLASTRT